MKVLDASLTDPIKGGASFTLGNRLFRVLWMFAWLVAARFTPPPFHAWRRLVLRIFGAQVARGARVHGSVRIWHPHNLSIAQHALIGPGAILYNQGHIAIGARTIVSQRAHVCASTHDVRDPNFQLLLRPITIGADCWIAAEAFVGPGVTMGDGAVLAARGALFDDAKAQTIYRGNPAEPLRERALRV